MKNVTVELTKEEANMIKDLLRWKKDETREFIHTVITTWKNETYIKEITESATKNIFIIGAIENKLNQNDNSQNL